MAARTMGSQADSRNHDDGTGGEERDDEWNEHQPPERRAWHNAATPRGVKGSAARGQFVSVVLICL